jgi:8-oxo-dGTP pyrophosphatase MutT (NUDIX family)
MDRAHEHNEAMTSRFKPSVTVAAIIEQQGRFLLVEERTPEGLKLNNPAGHLDEGESLVQACLREALEETARHFTPTHLLGMYMSRFQRPSTAEDVTYLRFAFCGMVGEAIAGQALDSPIVRTLWLTPQEIRASSDHHRSPMLLRCMEDYLAGQRLPLNAILQITQKKRPLESGRVSLLLSCIQAPAQGGKAGSAVAPMCNLANAQSGNKP